jgi:hypothetical protein
VARPSARRALVAASVLLLAGLGTGRLAGAGTPAADAHGDGARWDDLPAVRARLTTPAPATTPTVPAASTAAPASSAAPASPAAPPATPAAPATPATPATPAAPPATPAAPPELGRSVALAAVSGTVLVRVPGRAGATALTTAAGPLPTGTRVDTRHGAVDAAGTTQTGRFSGGVFEVRQAPGGRGLTQIVLVGGHWGACPARPRRPARTARAAAAPTAHAARRRRKPIRRLWGHDDHGRFQTRGGGSIATVRGTRWLTEDFCDGTRTTVTAGAVAVRSRRTGRTVLVRAGHSRFVAR